MAERENLMPERELSMLDQWLAQGYSGAVIKGMDKTADFAQALRRFPSMKTEAQAKLKGLTDAICKRDHISRVIKEVLTKALAESDKEVANDG